MKVRIFKNIALALGTTFVALVFCELILGFFGGRVFEQGRLFAFDPIVGWKGRVGITQERKNADGTTWSTRINDQGFRERSDWRSGASHRILLLGDSYVFGFGISVDDRFDTVLERDRPSWSIVNRGMPGYGTDQELISARPLISSLTSRDAVVLVTYSNDFYDVLRHTFVGRVKPWFSLDDGKLSEHAPSANFLHTLRDYSYLVSRLLTVWERPQHWYAHS